jgi:hypothetical protein
MDGMEALGAANPEKAAELLDFINKRAAKGRYSTHPSNLITPLNLSATDKAQLDADAAAHEAEGASADPRPRFLKTSETVPFALSPGHLINGCHVCSKQENTSRCGGCKVVWYCGQAHQASDRPAHKSFCTAIKKARVRLDAQEISLRTHAGDEDTPRDAFAQGGQTLGRFWGFAGTQPYMHARHQLIDALLRVNTPAAVEAALDHALDMLRLNASDTQGIRSIVPALFLRLRRDQDCYDFVKRWNAIGSGTGDELFNWAAAPRRQDAFEPVIDFLKGYNPLAHLVALALLKIRMLVDMRRFAAGTPPSFTSSIVARDQAAFASGGSDVICDWLRKLIMNLYVAVACANPHFWPAVREPGAHLTNRPNGYMVGGEEEMQLTLQWCYSAWVESDGAREVLEEMEGSAEVKAAMRSFSEG